MFWRLGGQFGGGWGVVWCKPRVPPKIAKIRLRIIRVSGNFSPCGRRTYKSNFVLPVGQGRNLKG